MKMNLERTNIFQSDGQFLDARHGKSSVSPNQKTRTIQSVDRALIILEIIQGLTFFWVPSSLPFKSMETFQAIQIWPLVLPGCLVLT